MPAPHVPTGPTTAPPDEPAGPWLAVSAAMTAAVPALAGRDDLVVTCAPGAGRGSPACFLPALASVEVDGTHLGGLDPAAVDPSRPADRERYPALWGLLCHEAAHAAHSRWTHPPAAPSAAATAADLLEESRIEAAHLARRPGDRHWLRAATTTIVLAEFAPDPEPEPAPPAAPPAPGTAAPAGTLGGSPWDAATAAALLLARADAGVVDDDELTAVAGEVTAVLGTDTLDALTALWRAAHTVADTDGQAMADLARAWCELLDVDPDAPPPAPTGDPTAPSPLARAVGGTLTGLTAAPPSYTPPGTGPAARAEEKAARTAAEHAAGRVFAPGAEHPASCTETTQLAGRRPPTAAEQAAARRLARALRAAAAREPVTTLTTAPVPPGRLRTRDAVAAAAQRANGTPVTAEPFTRTTRRRTPAPPLKIGIACDVSGTMHAFAGTAASAAWTTARAAGHVHGTTTATVIFGEDVRPVTRPGRAPADVTEFHSVDDAEQFTRAVDALDHTLGLSRPGAARLLVVVSDGIFTTSEYATGQRRLDRLAATGCALVWVAPDHPRTRPMRGTRRVTLADPATLADTVAKAAASALAAA